MRNIFLLFFSLIVFSCNTDKNTKKTDLEESKSILNGLYHVEYEITDIKYIWVVTEEMIYTFYPGSDTFINYEIPTYYYIEDNKIYMCGIGPDWGPLPLSECKKKIKTPLYIIVSDKTVSEPYSDDEIQVVTLKDYDTNKSIILKRKLY